MKQNGNNIIFDDDVTLTGGNAGEKLSGTLGSLLSRVTKLESYLKWLYGHGGVGGGTGSGGGSGGSGSYSLYATLNDIQLKQNTISLGSNGHYPLYFKIQNPGGATFSVVYKYSEINNLGIEVTRSERVTLSIDNNYEYSKTINLNNNSTITVTATDSVYNITKQASAKYITRTYNIRTSFLNNLGEDPGSEVYVINAKQNGLNIKFEYDFAVTSTFTTYLSFNIGSRVIETDVQTIVTDNQNRKGEIKYDLIELGKKYGWEPSDETSGLYTASVYTNIRIDGTDIPTQVDTKTFTLIPSSLYLLVQHSTGEIYQGETEPTIDPEKIYSFYVGNVVLNTRAYFGTAQGQACIITYRVNDDKNTSSYTTTLREQNQVKLFLSREGWNKVQFNLSSSNTYYPSRDGFVTYWVHCKKPNTKIKWPTIEKNLDGSFTINRESGGSFSFYRQGDQWGGSQIPGLSDPPLTSLKNETGGKALVMTSTKEAFSASDLKLPENNAQNRNTAIFIGLKYSEINKDNTVIMTGERQINTSFSEVFSITQDKIKIGNNIEIKYFLPKTLHENYTKDTEYHLLTIISRYIKSSGNTPLYELLVFVDGRIEGAAKDYSNVDLCVDRVNFLPSNSTFNLLELDYLNTNFKKEVIDGIPQPTKDSIPEDLMVYQYWLKYRSTIVDPVGRPATDKEEKLLNYCDAFDIQNIGEVLCTNEGISNIAQNIDVPTLVMTIKDDGTTKAALDQGYKEGDDLPIWDTTLSWADGKGNALAPILPDNKEFPQARFTIKPQGSSTLQYKCKNFTLTLLNGDNEDVNEVYLFSPNFNSKDTSTFLPEQSFTLKADVVDSSHSNNTSIGRFVNRVTKKFDTLDNSSLGSYVKNCLDGFPMIVYIDLAKETVESDGSTTTTHTYYYQGIYNFNLGRSSFYNLGYKDSNVFLDSNKNIDLDDAGKGFTFYKVNTDKDTLKDGLIVAEIQGNSPYFDFSQWDQTILYQSFSSAAVDSEPYMFGDFVSGPDLEETRAKNIIQRLVYNVSKAGGFLFNDHLKKRFSNDEKTHCGYDQGYCARGEIERTMYERELNGEYKLDGKGQKIPILGEDGLPKKETVVAPLNQVPNYLKHYVKGLNGTEIVYKLADVDESGEFNMKPGGLGHLRSLIIGDKDSGIEPWIDYQSLSEYYTICMAFGLIDSVQKNMNIKSWTGKWDNSGGTGRAKFYAAFYDMDTCLGINNAGSETSYFAFSDYWQYSDSSESAGAVRPGQVTIYRDYSPPAESGGDGDKLTSADFYDTPSSYLFAVAKYAKLEEGVAGTEIANWPKELWAKWRSSTINEADPTQACLRSASYFIDNYFASNIDAVSIPMVNMNYRNKYFVKSEESSTFSNTNFAKFNGTRIAKAADWLNGRFHILDAYFNLPKATNPIQYYTEDNIYENIVLSISETGVPVYKGEPNFSGTSYALNSNTDITILQDIFNEDPNNVKQGSGNLSFNIKAKEYSPFIVNTANNSYKYLLEGGDIMYNVVLTLNGMQTYNLYGSGAWTDLDSVDTFRYKDLSVNSKYLSSLSGTGRHAMNVIGSNIKMPSLETLVLSGGNFTGNFVGGSSDGVGSDSSRKIDGTRYPNLNSINLSNNSISAEINNSGCSRINISKKLDNSTISITGCNNLEALELGTGTANDPATSMENLTIVPVTLPLCKTTSTNNDSGGFVMDSCKIHNLTLVNQSTTDNGNTRVCITNDYRLQTLSIGGFAQVYISNCPNLQEISISDPREGEGGDALRLLHIHQCGNSIPDSGLMSINKSSGGDGICQLSGYEDLKRVRISNCQRITEVRLPQHAIELPSSAFASDSKLTYLSGGSKNNNDLYIMGTNTFSNCTNFTLLESDSGAQTKLMVHADNTNISGTFSCNGGGSIKIAQAKEFLKSSVPASNRITNISGLFNGQPIRYTEKELLTDLKGETSIYLDMSVFKRVTNISNAFAWCGITAWHPKMFEVGTENNDSVISTENYCKYGGLTEVTTTLDILKYIIEKADYLFVNAYDQVIRFRFVDGRGEYIGMSKENPVSLYDFFHPAHPTEGRIQNPKNVRTLIYFGLDRSGGRHYDWRKLIDDSSVGVFDRGWTSLTYIQRFLADQEYGDEQLNIGEIFKVISAPGTKLNSTYEILNVRQTVPVDLMTLFNWENVSRKSTNFFSNRKDTISGNEHGSLRINKYITSDNFRSLCMILGSGNLTGLENIFRNCTVLSSSSIPIDVVLGSKDKINNTITSVDNLFNGFKVVNVGSELGNITEELLKDLGNRENIYSNFRNVFSNLKSIKTAVYTFSGVYISESLPFNFFNKRRRTDDSRIYIVKDSMKSEFESSVVDKSKVPQSSGEKYFEQATVCRYSYNRQLTNLYSCFENTKWLRDDINENSLANARRFNDTSKDLEADYIRKTDGSKVYATDPKQGLRYYILETMTEWVEAPDEPDGGHYNYVTYYTYKNSQEVRVSDNTELTDLTEFLPPKNVDDEGKYIGQFTVINGSGTQKTITNFSVAYDDSIGKGSSLDKLFCPPDILYGCVEGCVIDRLFSNTANSDETLEGTIPANMMKYCKNSKFPNLFKNLNILPRYLWKEVSNSGYNITERSIYYYVPKGFTIATNLDYAFNFHFMVPGAATTTPNTSTPGTTTKVNAYYVLLNESISDKTISLGYGFPSVYKELYAQNQPGIWTTGSGGKTNSYTPLQYNLMYIPNGSITEDGTGTGEDGLNITGKFRNLNLDNIIQSPLTAELYGRLFDKGFFLQNMKKANQSNYIMTVLLWNDTTNYISANMIFPSLSPGVSFADQKIIDLDGPSNLYIARTQIENGDTPGVKESYETITDGSNRSVIVV